jgi:hypothetical protein
MFPNFFGPICNNNNNKIMTKLSLMISHMSFMNRIQVINLVIYFKIPTSAWAM